MPNPEITESIDQYIINDTWLVQKSFDDMVLFSYLHHYKNTLQNEGIEYDEADRTRLGFNKSGSQSEDDVQNQKNIIKNITRRAQRLNDNDPSGNKSMEEFQKILKSLGALQIRIQTNIGAQYQNLYDSLEGEEHRDLKAEYLLNSTGTALEGSTFEEFQGDITTDLSHIINKTFDKRFPDPSTATMGDLAAMMDIPKDVFLAGFSLKDDMKAVDFIQSDARGRDISKEELNSLIITMMCRNMVSYHMSQGRNEVYNNLSEKEKEFHQTAFKHFNNTSNLDPIGEWIGKKGNQLREDIKKVKVVSEIKKCRYELCNSNPITSNKSMTDTTKKLESNKKINDCIKSVIKGERSADEITERIVKYEDKKYDNEMTRIYKKSLKSATFDNYMLLHTGRLAGNTEAEKQTNLSKVLAAYSMKATGKKFNVKEIRKTAKYIEELYDIKNLKGERLDNALKDVNYTLKEGARLRNKLYGINDVQSYLKDMKTLSQNLTPEKGHSDEYKKLVKCIKDIASLDKTTSNLSENEKQESIIYANIKLVQAVEKYIKGRENVSSKKPGTQACVNNALDALSILSKHTKTESMPVNNKAVSIINGMNKLRKGDQVINIASFDTHFGAENAKNAKAQRELANNNKQKNIGLNKIKSLS